MIKQELAKRYLGSADPLVRARGVSVISQHSNPANVQRLSLVLASDPEEEVRLAAAAGLGRLGLRQGLPSLFDAVRRDASLPVRVNALRAVGAIQDPGAASQLIELWRSLRDSDDAAVHIGCVAALKSLGPVTIPALLPALADADWRVRRGAVAALRAIGGSGLKHYIAPLAADAHALVRTEVQLALAELP